MGLGRRHLLAGALGAGAAALVGGCERRRFTLFNWADYLAESVGRRFEEVSGYRLEVHTFASAHHMRDKLAIGAQYDVCLTIDHMLSGLVAEGLLRPISPEPEGLEHLDPALGPWRAPVEQGGQLYGVPYLWGTTGICFDPARVGDVDSWSALFDPRFRGHISVLDSRPDALDQVLLAGGYRREQVTRELLREEIKPRLEAQKKLLRRWDSSPADALVSGETWIAQCDSGDALRAARRRPGLRFVIPREGASLWTDYMVFAATAPRPHDSVKFIEVLLDPEWAAVNANELMYASPNQSAASRGLLELADDPWVYPDAEVRARLFRHLEFSGDVAEIAQRIWLEVRTT